MRRLVILLIACPMIGLSFGPQVRNMMLEIASRRDADDGPTTEGLVAYWSMRESGGTVYDEHGDNDGTVQGGVTFGATGGVRDNGATFNGTTGHIVVPDDSTLNMGTSDFSVSFWLKTTTADGYPRIFGKSATESFEVYLNEIGGVLRVGLDALFFSPAGGTDVTDNAWYHVAIVFERSANATFYINGQVDGTVDISSKSDSDLTNVLDFIIGANWDGASRFLTGSLDEARVYTRILTQEEVTGLYDYDKDGAGH